MHIYTIDRYLRKCGYIICISPQEGWVIYFLLLILLKVCLLRFKGSCLWNCLKASVVKFRLKTLDVEGKGWDLEVTENLGSRQKPALRLSPIYDERAMTEKGSSVWGESSCSAIATFSVWRCRSTLWLTW